MYAKYSIPIEAPLLPLPLGPFSSLNIVRFLGFLQIPNRLISISPMKRARDNYLTGSTLFLCLNIIKLGALITLSHVHLDGDLNFNFLFKNFSPLDVGSRLIYRSKQRGFLELDLVLGKWVEEHIHSMDENGIKALVRVPDLVQPVYTTLLFSRFSVGHKPLPALTINEFSFSAHRGHVLYL